MANPPRTFDGIPVGFRFHPTDEELVAHYLKNKLIGGNFVDQVIPVIDLCKYEPSDLPAFSVIKSDDPEWFFFSPLDYKYSNSKRANRATERGFWKATGRDRNIKVRGTNNVIGTKKTLVFYEGRTPHGVKTSWVIHEYHTVMFPENQRTFVLCRLMKKPDKNAEEKTDELFHDEEEPRSHTLDVHPFPADNVDSDVMQPQPYEYDPHFIHQTPIPIEQESPFQFPSLPNSFIRNDNDGALFPLETTEEEENVDAFVSSLLVDDDVLYHEEMTIGFANNSTIMVQDLYYESSDTDAEVVSAWRGNVPETANSAGSIEYRPTKMGKSSHSAEQVGTSQISSNQEKTGISFQDDLLPVDTSSGDSSPARIYQINYMHAYSSPKSFETQYQPRSANSVSLRPGTRRSQTQRKVSTKATSHHEAHNEAHKAVNRNWRKSQSTISRNSSKATSSQSSGVNRRGAFIHWETSSRQNISPPSVYIVNVVIGLVLFVVFVCEMLSCGRFY